MNLKINIEKQKGEAFKETDPDIIAKANEISKLIEEEILKKDNTLTKELKDTESKMKEFGKKALVIRQKIKLVQSTIQGLSKRAGNGVDTEVALQRQYSLLKFYLKEGYTFIMELRRYVTNETMGYGIRISDNKEESLGIYTMEEMLSMTTLEETDNHFKLVFKNIETINRLANKQNDDLAEDMQTILKIYRGAKRGNEGPKEGIRQRVLRLRREKRDTDPSFPIYFRGLSGFMLERAFIEFAKGNKDAEQVNSIKTDTDRYSSGGDLQGEEVFAKIRNKYTNLEIKNVTKAGSSLVNLDTLVKDLDKIVEICLSSRKRAEAKIKNKLKTEIFKNPGKLKVSKYVTKILNEMHDEIFDNLIKKDNT